MWGIGLIFLCMFGLFLINTFGNITVVNQQDFTALTNTVEAAMNDAIDYAHFRSGFCVCTNTGGWDFTSSNQYEIEDPDFSNDSGCNQEKNCKLVEGEYKIDKDLFTSSLNERFARAVRGKDEYKIIVTDIIEYPPKVSVVVRTNFYEKEVEIHGENYASKKGGFVYGGTSTIVNNINAILESYSTYTSPPEPTIKPTPTPTPKPTKTPKPTAKPTSAPKPTTKPTTKPSTSKPKPTATPKPTTAPKSCFLEGTKIVTANGYRDIDKLFIGEKVLTYNEKTKKNEYKSVLHTFKFEDAHEELYTIKINGNTEFSLTGYHRVYAYRDGEYKYIPANELVVGDIVRYSSSEEHTITDISYETINKMVYNLETEDNHNFYIGNEGILVHNMESIRFVGPGGPGASNIK